MRDLFGNKEERAIELLRMYQPKDQPYYGCFSGGKDSCVICVHCGCTENSSIHWVGHRNAEIRNAAHNFEQRKFQGPLKDLETRVSNLQNALAEALDMLSGELKPDVGRQDHLQAILEDWEVGYCK